MSRFHFTLLLLLFTFHHIMGQIPVHQEPDGGGYFAKIPLDEITPEHRKFIESSIKKNKKLLNLHGIIQKQDSTQTEILGWPLRAADGFNDYGYHGTSAFVDHNPEYPNKLLDYNGGKRTYDTKTGYNHTGVDFFLWPFPWYKMDNNQVEVVAAARGTIIFKESWHFDRNYSWSNLKWNAIYIMHENGSIAWYGHLKKYSLTSKIVGENVEKGEFLGIVGSSGNSTGPHLHFEIHDKNDMLIDPFSGRSNRMNKESWWIKQPPYYDSAINTLLIHDKEPVFAENSEQEILNIKQSFKPGNSGKFTAYYRDQKKFQNTVFRIYRPDGSIFDEWSNVFSRHYAASWWWWRKFLPQNAEKGNWKFEASYNQKKYSYNFYVDGFTPNSISNFKLEIKDGKGHLSWSTDLERDNSGFQIIDRFKGISRDLGFVKGVGTSYDTQVYRFVTDKLDTGQHEFKLKQINSDSTFNYSDPIQIFILNDIYQLSNIFPNPSNSAIKFVLILTQDQKIEINIYNGIGQKVQNVYSGIIAAHQEHTFTLNMNDLASGIYFLGVYSKKFQSFKKFIKIR